MFNTIPSKSECHSSQRLKKIYPKVHLETQKAMNSQGNTEQKEHTGDITIPDFKLYYRAKEIKTA
jgi:hypothetical protein